MVAMRRYGYRPSTFPFRSIEKEPLLFSLGFGKMAEESESVRVGMAGGEPGIEALPEACIANAISLTSPRDACRSSAVSAAFRSAVASDTVWDRFLPSDLKSILARADHPVDFSSKRELFFRLCDRPIFFDGGKMTLSLDRSSGAKCYMLSARELVITWADTNVYWRWVPDPDSRFSEVAELLDVCWLEIHGHFNSKMLSSKTKYAAHLIFKLSDSAVGLDYPPQEASVKLGTQSSTNLVCLQPNKNQDTDEEDTDEEATGHVVPQSRGDGWMEIELGELYNNGEEGEDNEVDISLLEVKGGHWKDGLIIEGIEIRPKI
ncbi:F-box protein PP2-B10-like [Zingiber officinale]|uniref:F-box domain-containing protein n=1 Tax=Zingiber officinale TaxID=94328 RepID=A0A8J5KGN4_ZINOF|nr:F-box protein PP2-B10-like [Zingiber officinale]KAG6475607.1 hypothetical protein ZIOFF_064835 [Zingiber officinale]